MPKLSKQERKAARAAAALALQNAKSDAAGEHAVDAAIAAQEPAITAVPTRTLRLPLPEARAHNAGFTLVTNGGPVVAAGIALTSKGTNPRKVRVYGYDNLTAGNGRVPKLATVALVPGIAAAPKGVATSQWDKLVGLATAGTATVQHLYDNGVASRTVRRSYRAGAIRFLGAAESIEE